MGLEDKNRNTELNGDQNTPTETLVRATVAGVNDFLEFDVDGEMIGNLPGDLIIKRDDAIDSE